MNTSLVIIDKIIYPITLVSIIILAFALVNFAKRKVVTNVRFEKSIGFYALFHNIVTLFVFYLMFDRGADMLQTDLSPFVFILIMIPFITQKFYWLRKALMPYLLLSAFVSMSLSHPGFSWNFKGNEKYLSMFIESFFTYIKHTLILIMGVYLFITNSRYKGNEWALGLFVPAALITWIFISSGMFLFIIGNPLYGQSSTGILISSVIPWGGYEEYINGHKSEAFGLSDREYNYIIEHHPSWKHLFININGKWYAKYLTNESLWGESYYSGSGEYSIVMKFAEILRVPFYVITIIFYLICISVGYLAMVLSRLNKEKSNNRFVFSRNRK